MKGRTGASMVTRDGYHRAKRRKRAREREEQRWAEMSGPVVTYFREPEVSAPLLQTMPSDLGPTLG